MTRDELIEAMARAMVRSRGARYIGSARAALSAIEAAGFRLIRDDDGSAAEVKAISETMQEIYDDPIARGSGLICTKMLKRAMIAAGRV